MGKSHILQANWFDYPQYYDIAFQAPTQREADFIEAACRKYCPFAARRFLEPACGSGRLTAELAARGYQVTGFDLSQPALSYLRRRLARRRLHAETFEAEMSDFRLGRQVDAAYRQSLKDSLKPSEERKFADDYCGAGEATSC